jgi:hypothetical protein
LTDTEVRVGNPDFLVSIRGLYRGRWGIENQGFRSLSQTWDIDRPAGHSYGAVLARLV